MEDNIDSTVVSESNDASINHRIAALIDDDIDSNELDSQVNIETNKDHNQKKMEKSTISAPVDDSDNEINLSRKSNESNTCVEEELNLIKPKNKLPNKTKKFKMKITDSDSENEFYKSTESIENVEKLDSDINVSKETNFNRLKNLIDSDSEDEPFVKSQEKFKNITDSDSQENDNDSENETSETNNDLSISNKKKTEIISLNKLCDTDSSEDEISIPFDERNDSEFPEQESSITLKSGKEALEQRRQIKSENQRMMRESRVSLPYHRPKSHTLKEFLSQRSRLSDVVSPLSHVPKSLAIKMSAEQLKIAAQRIKEREKEIEQFYKSDSESEKENKSEIQSNITDPQNKVSEKNSDDIYEKLDVDNSIEIDITKKTAIVNDESSVKDKNNSKELCTENITLQNDTCDISNDANKCDSEIKSQTPDIEKQNSSNIEELIIKYDQIDSVKTPLDMVKTEPEKKMKIINPLVSLKSTFQPRLSGGPNEMIILDDGLKKSKGINNLMKRFITHTTMKKQNKSEEIRILNVDGGKLQNEIHILAMRDEEEDRKHVQTPGAKLKKLREELEEQMAKKRLEQWMKRSKEKEEEIIENEKNKCIDNNELSEDEEEITDTESSESDSDEEMVQEKRKPKSAFINDEADESEFADSENEDEFNDRNEISEVQTKKQLCRILQTYDESDDDTVDLNMSKNQSSDDEDDKIPLHQPGREIEKTPCRPNSVTEPDYSFLTPTIQLSGLQGMSSATKSVHESPKVSIPLLEEPSFLRSQFYVKANLFQKNYDGNEDNFDELEELCSGRFTNTNKKSGNLENHEVESQGLNIGIFSSTDSIKSLKVDKEITDEISKNINESENMKLVLETSKEEENESIDGNLKDVSSDEDEIKNNPNKNLYPKKIMKICVSDEESSNDNIIYENTDDEDEIPKNIEYDSEENEIDLETVEKEHSARFKIGDFFEAEAELSESEWGSADEDERDLDQMDIEDGDAEQFNHKKIQQELEKIHMRQILDEDKREVRILQELLLEDGELHGAGRERKFRWKNADLNTWNDAEGPIEDDDEIEDVESELNWRKMRHEREKFLEEQRSKERKNVDELKLITDNSQLLMSGQEALQAKSDDQIKENPQAKTEDISITNKFLLLNKRGSFLARSESTLTRLAEITKISNNQLGTGPKNSRNFLFTSVTKTNENEIAEVKKRKAIGNSSRIMKKIKVIDTSLDKRNNKNGKKV